ncbi:hypothetical protein [Lactiplantibacillus fabifermentans]|nr:hypothetical protein [Lactiplantibacillus fabifermentans]ETY74977.1 hypothetical protein LFAB_04250 [Lactiplantibacillus fabifermentans T30PCM01]
MGKLIFLGCLLLTLITVNAFTQRPYVQMTPPAKKVVTAKATATNQQLATKLTKEFNQYHANAVKTTVATEVYDEQSKTNRAGVALPHQEVAVLVTDKKARQIVKEAQKAVEGYTATPEQRRLILGIQAKVSKAAKKLKGVDTISFGYQKSKQHQEIIASSTRQQDLIEPISLETD